MKKIIILVFILISCNSFGQQITFQKTFGGTGDDVGNSVQQTTDGGYIIAGNTGSYGAGGNDVYLIKTNAYGDSLWTKTFGGIDGDYGESVRQTTDAGFIITGEFYSLNMGNHNVYLIKTDSNGNVLWTKMFNSPNDDRGNSVQQTNDGGFIITGYTYSFGAGNYDVYLIKTDSIGNFLWSKTFGGSGEERGNFVQQTSDGGYIVAGYTKSFGAGNYDTYLIKTDINGDTIWTKTFGGTDYDDAWSVLQTADGGFIVMGSTKSFGAGNYDIYLVKTDSMGNLLWAKIYGGINRDTGCSLHQTNDGGYIVTGFTDSFGAGSYDAYLLKTDVNGNILWSKTFGGVDYDYGYSVQSTFDGGYTIAGRSYNFGAGTYDVYLIKTDSLGNSGCNQSSSTTIIGIPAIQVTTPPTIVTSPTTIVTTPATIVGSGGTVTTLYTTVGIQPAIQNPQSAISISPNPTTNNFTITFPNTINKGVIEIYNVMGKKIYKENIAEVSQKEIHLKNIGAGIYFVKVRDGEKEYCKKLVVE